MALAPVPFRPNSPDLRVVDGGALRYKAAIMSTYEHLLVTVEDSLGRITFNRPDKRNAMIAAMGDEVERAVAELNGNPDVRVVVVTGAGKVFSAGGDLDMIIEQTKRSPAESRDFMAAYYRRYFALRELTMPTIAMLNGHAIGAGLCVALACDLRTAADHAKMGLTFVRLGLNVGMGGTYTLPQLVGFGRAAELVLTGDLIDAQRAFDIGLVNRVCVADRLEDETLELARSIARHGPHALRYTKRSLYAGLGHDLEHVFDVEADGQSYCYQTADILEGVESVRQKRAPEFKGK